MTKAKATRNAQIKAMYRAGHSLGEVGAKFTLSRERVRQVLVSLGVTKRHGCGVERTAQWAEAHERRRIVKEALETHRAKRHARNMQIKKLYDSGVPVVEISTRFGHTQQFVCNIARAMGCKMRVTWMSIAARKDVLKRVKAKELYTEIAKAHGISYANVVRIVGAAKRGEVMHERGTGTGAGAG